MAKHEIVGGWVDLREPREVPERLRRPIVVKAGAIGKAAQNIANADEVSVDEDTLSAMFEFNDLLVIALAKAWSFEEPITLEGLGNLPGNTYDALQKIVAPMVTDLMPSFEATPDADSPTVPSDA